MADNKVKLTSQQRAILESDKKNLIVSASAGSGKTFVVIEYLKGLIRDKKIPLSKLLVLTFTKAAAGEMKARLTKGILEGEQSEFLTQQLDEIPLADISTIHAFCERLLKRYVGMLDLPQNFVVLDEKEGKTLKIRAFNDAFNHYSHLNDEDFASFYNAYKGNKELMLKSVEDLASFLESQQEALEDDLLAGGEYLEKSRKFLTKYIRGQLSKCRKMIEGIDYSNMEEAYSQYAQKLYVNLSYSGDFLDICRLLRGVELDRFPTKKTEHKHERETLSRAKDLFLSLQKLVGDFACYDMYAGQEGDNHVARALIKIYKAYKEGYSALKLYRNGLDFSDLERYAGRLLENKDILKDLQDRYDYIFIDEYQDTNPLQESFVKKIARGGCFIGVGDPKQGIYGFRNASMEIMKRDIEEFSRDKDSDALYLTGNFRSDKHILGFVNDIFSRHMTEESVGIDYAKTSILQGCGSFKDDGMPPVEVDILLPQKEEKEIRRGVYSVKEDVLGFEEKHRAEVLAIASKIEKYLSGMIYDSKREEFRRVSEGDIVVLFRKRGGIMEELSLYLEGMGHNVLSDMSKPLLEDGEVASVVSFVRLLICYDDISLASAMSSKVGGFSPQQLLKFRGGENSFQDNVISSDDEDVKAFLDKLSLFKREYNIFGLEKALRRLLEKSLYYAYLDGLENSGERKRNIDNLFKIIRGGFDFNPQGLIDYLEEGKNLPNVNGGKGITLTTIHATKGLEFPIVILAGCGESMGKTDNSLINFSAEFGLGTDLYDFENNTKISSLTKLANKLHKQNREFVDELMIFYVALTRAQNHLVLTGSLTKDGMSKLYLNKTYLALVLNAYGENFLPQLLNAERIDRENVRFNVISEVEEDRVRYLEERKASVEVAELEDYINFSYPHKNASRKFKNSVTSIMEREGNYEVIAPQNISEDWLERGLAYHEALRILPFEEINSLEDLERLLTPESLTEGYYEKIDRNLLLKNILIIKSVLGGQKAEKEREFIMSCPLNELNEEGNERVIIQGIIDLFSMGERNILIDYKFTSQRDEGKIIEKYLSQLKLYEKALFKSFGKNIDEKYILSLKEGRLIKVDI